jgi:dTDP-4-dehydrorhamnose 3,5-epimerase
VPFRAIATPLPGLVVLEPTVFGDERGYFLETYHQRAFAEAGIDVAFVQDNEARSRRGILRGLHFQKTHPQAKLVRVLRGRVFDVAVDLRRTSPTFGRWHGVTLDDRTKQALFVPAGFAHGYLALEEPTDLTYKCSDFYDPEDEGGVIWDDPELAIAWPLGDVGAPLLSDKDRRYPRLAELGFAFP